MEKIETLEKLQTKYEKQKRINLEQNQFIDSLKTNIINLQKENRELRKELQHYKDNIIEDLENRDRWE